ncbi:hypothetical protein BH11GEM2_BH11GEM2_14760 [soil metagenome]
MPASEGLVISRTVQATPTSSVKSRELVIAIRLEDGAPREHRGAVTNMPTAPVTASAARHAQRGLPHRRCYWYWMYNGLGFRRRTSAGVSMAAPLFVSLWKNSLNPVNCTGSAFT